MNPERPPSIEEHESNEKEKTIEQQEGERVAALVEKLYDKLPSRLASHFVEPSVILTMAGHKGIGEYHLSLPREEQKQKEEFQAFQKWTEEANLILEKEGHPEIKFIVSGKTFDEARGPIFKGGEVFGGRIINVKTLERLIEGTQIPGIPKYDSSTSLEGALLWTKEAEEALKQARNQGELPGNLTDEALSAIAVGLALGYPDRALLDFADWMSQDEQDETKLEDSGPMMIGEYDKYKSPVPSFYYYPEHAKDPGIQENIRMAHGILKGFYESDWHKNLENDSTFLETRRIQEDLHSGIYEESADQ